MKNEILIYQSAELTERIEVRMEDESIWLNRNQIALLFGRDIKTIGKHIKNALTEELNGSSVVANFATTASDGKVYIIEHFNLEMVISIGYRVKSNRGTQFRIWANQVLKDYLLKGYAVNNRMNRMEDHFENTDKSSLTKALHNLFIPRISQQQFRALKELEIAKIEAGCYGAGNQGEAVIFQNGAAENGVFGDPEKGLLAFG